MYLLDLPIENAETIAAICGFLNGDHLISKPHLQVTFEAELHIGFSEHVADYKEAREALERAISRGEIPSEPVYHAEDGYPDNYLIKKNDLDRWANNPASKIENELNAKIFELGLALDEARAKIIQLETEKLATEQKLKEDELGLKSKRFVLELIGGLLAIYCGKEVVQNMFTSVRNNEFTTIMADLDLKGFPRNRDRGTIRNYIKAGAEAFTKVAEERVQEDS